jgi:hypothetical protein
VVSNIISLDVAPANQIWDFGLSASDGHIFGLGGADLAAGRDVGDCKILRGCLHLASFTIVGGILGPFNSGVGGAGARCLLF